MSQLNQLLDAFFARVTYKLDGTSKSPPLLSLLTAFVQWVEPIGNNEHNAGCFLVKSMGKCFGFGEVPFGRICLARMIVDMTHHVTHQAPVTPRPGI